MIQVLVLGPRITGFVNTKHDFVGSGDPDSHAPFDQNKVWHSWQRKPRFLKHLLKRTLLIPRSIFVLNPWVVINGMNLWLVPSFGAGLAFPSLSAQAEMHSALASCSCILAHLLLNMWPCIDSWCAHTANLNYIWYWCFRTSNQQLSKPRMTSNSIGAEIKVEEIYIQQILFFSSKDCVSEKVTTSIVCHRGSCNFGTFFHCLPAPTRIPRNLQTSR